MSNTQALLDYITANGKDKSWAELAELFGFTSGEAARSFYKRNKRVSAVPVALPGESLVQEQGENKVIVMELSVPIKNEKELIKQIDADVLKEWDLTEWACRKRDVQLSKNPDRFIALYSVTAKFKKRKITEDLNKQKELVLEALKRVYGQVNDDPKVEPPKTGRAMEIFIPDLHIGKLAWDLESGADYDIDIAVRRYSEAVIELTSYIKPGDIEKFILPIGNDMINIDNKQNTTTAGTPQNCDTRFFKMFKTAKKLLIDTIEYLQGICPVVDVIVIPGNHDSVSMLTLGEVLEAYYHSDANVTVYNSPFPRKYYQYGKNLIMYVHGDKEKFNELPLICATEVPELWAATRHRRAHIGHLHHSKQYNFLGVNEHKGFVIKVFNSLSESDAWHIEKGYISNKQAEAFIYDFERGITQNFIAQI